MGLGGMTTSSYIVHDYITSGHMDLYSTHVLYTEYKYISMQYIYF